MTRDEWIDACGKRFAEVAGLIDAESVRACADGCADAEQEENGPDASSWAAPAEAADEEMSYWTDDGE
mgnify:CR=1 FL=1